MRIENNTLVTNYCAYPFDEIELVGEVYNDGAKFKPKRTAWTFQVKVSDHFAVQNRITTKDGVVTLKPISDANHCIECYNAIKQSKLN